MLLLLGRLRAVPVRAVPVRNMRMGRAMPVRVVPVRAVVVRVVVVRVVAVALKNRPSEHTPASRRGVVSVRAVLVPREHGLASRLHFLPQHAPALLLRRSTLVVVSVPLRQQTAKNIIGLRADEFVAAHMLNIAGAFDQLVEPIFVGHVDVEVDAVVNF